MKPNTITFALLILLASSCDDSADPASTSDNNPSAPVSESQSKSEPLKRGPFTSYAHGLAGSVALYNDSLDMKTLHLEEFTMTQGPDVRVYLSKSNNYSIAKTLEVAKLKESYVNKDIGIPISQYSEDYKFVLVYCLEFHSLFGYAELK